MSIRGPSGRHYRARSTAIYPRCAAALPGGGTLRIDNRRRGSWTCEYAAVCAVAVVVPGAAPRRRPSRASTGRSCSRATAPAVTTDIWTMSPNGRNPVNLTAGSPASDGNASWRPDGRKIVVHQRSRDAGQSHAARLDGTRLRGLRDERGRVATRRSSRSTTSTTTACAWSPDGRLLLVQRDLDPVRGQSDYDLFTDAGRRQARAQPHELARRRRDPPRLVARRRADRLRERPRRRQRDLHDEAGRLAPAPAHDQHGARRRTDLVARRPQDRLHQRSRPRRRLRSQATSTRCAPTAASRPG